MTTVTWVQNGNGQHEISSREHLQQLMNKGSLHSDLGTPPLSYWASGTSYVQTADIDLLGDGTDIQPIGSNTDTFNGGYDGSIYKIANWVYVDPEFTTSNSCKTNVGLFGETSNAIIKNITLTGQCKIEGCAEEAGFVVGKFNGQATNIACDLEPGSKIEHGQGLNTSNSFAGAIFGHVTASTVTGCTLKGTVDFTLSADDIAYSGGVAGRFHNSTVRLIQNLAVFPSTIRAVQAGGIVGQCRDSTMSTCINAMTGDIDAVNYGGGICGDFYVSNSTSLNAHTFVNSMVGNINSGIWAGGITGRFRAIAFCHTFINYMTGDITKTVSGTNPSGMFGYLQVSYETVGLSSSILAMNGAVYRTVGYSGNSTSMHEHVAPVTVDTSFGLTFATNEYSTTSAPSGLVENVEIPSLPYATLSGTDSDGNTYDFDFVWANLSGNSSYDDHTHLILHKGDIHAPFHVNFDLPENNTTLYYTYVNANTLAVVQDLLTIAMSPGTWEVLTRSVNIVISIGAIPEAIAYKFTYEGPEEVEKTSFSGLSLDQNKHNIANLDPNTQYTVRWYTDTGGGYDLTSETITTTLANTLANHSIADFEKNGVFDLTILDDKTLTELSVAMRNIFATGNVVKISINNKDEQSTVINVGETLSLENVEGVLLPFADAVAGQRVSVVLSDSTTIDVNYNESNNTLMVGTDTYAPGDVFTLNEKKVRVLEYA